MGLIVTISPEGVHSGTISSLLASFSELIVRVDFRVHTRGLIVATLTGQIVQVPGHLVQVRDGLGDHACCPSTRCACERARTAFPHASMSFLIPRAPCGARLAGKRTERMMSGMSARRRHQRAQHCRLDGDGARRQDDRFAFPIGKRAHLRPRAAASLRAQPVASL